ncbi:MAG: serine hydrolase [Alteromonadaceae bacterium]|nr:serine hydrolase [Alteromonadaceae bacterium]
MSTGLDCNDTQVTSTGNERNMFESEDWLEFFLTLPSAEIPGSEFAYCAGSVVGLAGVLEKTTQMKGSDFADEKLFQPLGITNYDWLKTNGDLLHPNGLFLRSRDMAKIGQVMLTGQWNGQDVISQQWLEEATSHQFYDADLDSLGYLWWRLTTHDPGVDYDLFYTHGKGGKTIMVVPYLNTVVVITAQNYTRHSLLENSRLVVDYIFPSLK